MLGLLIRPMTPVIYVFLLYYTTPCGTFLFRHPEPNQNYIHPMDLDIKLNHSINIHKTGGQMSTHKWGILFPMSQGLPKTIPSTHALYAHHVVYEPDGIICTLRHLSWTDWTGGGDDHQPHPTQDHGSPQHCLQPHPLWTANHMDSLKFGLVYVPPRERPIHK